MALEIFQEAISRARVQAAACRPMKTDNLTAQEQGEIAEMEARRAKSHERAEQAGEVADNNSEGRSL